MRSFRPRLAGALGVALVGTTLALGFSAPAQAASSAVVIAEVYGGGTNSGAANTYGNDFIELENRGTVPVSLDGWSVQYHSATGTGTFTVHELTGTIPAGARYLLQEGAFTTGTQFTPDETGTLNMAAGSGVVALVSNSAPFPTFGTTTGINVAGSTANGLIDLVGYGNTANTYETARTGTALSSTLSSNRKTSADSDHNLNDFQNAAPTPTACLCAPFKAASVSDKNYTAGEAISSFGLAASGGLSPYTWTATGLPDGVTVSSAGLVSGTPTTVGTYAVTATATDASTPANTSDTSFTMAVDPAPELASIGEVQGDGDVSPVVGKRVLVRGVVTGSYPNGTGNLAGFYMQSGGVEGVDFTDTPGASDGIFVFVGSKTAPAVGTSVEVTGTVEERFTSTQIAAGGASDRITTLASALPPVIPGDTIPGTDCALPGTDCLTGSALEALRESHEGEAFLPTGSYTVSDSYDGTPFVQSSTRGFQMQGEFGLAANSTKPLVISTEIIDQSDTAAIAAHRAWNDAHAVLLDDGADLDYTSNTNNLEDTSFPWLTPGNPVRVGAPVTFKKPVILEFRRDLWRVQPETKVLGGTTGADLVAFGNTRQNAPEDVLGATGDLKIATFNMLNYFNTYGEAWAASDGNGTGADGDTYNFANPRRCSFYRDRGTPGASGTTTELRLTNDTCTQDAVDPVTGLNVKLPGPRGAANEANFLRQESKELEAINTMDADVMSLEEVENSIKLYDAAIDGPNGADKDRDDALRHLVVKLNEHWAAHHPAYVGDRWAFVASPRPEALPTITEQDAIRSAFIYNPSKVEPVGRSRVLVNSAPFRNAREPLAQAFKPLGGGRADAFGVIVNHFKSKGGPTAPATVNGDNEDAGDGAGFYNGDRKRQAAALVAFANQFSADKNIDAMFLTGDYNAYAMEDPIQVITDAGYHDLHPADGAKTYSFGGLAGSLDHVFANEAAHEMVTGTDVWEINANESVYYEYSRYNANATDLYAVNAFRSSDHNPEIIGINSGGSVPDDDVDTVRVLATNDFHGRILDDPGSAAAGAASLAGAVKTLRAENEDLVFAAAGDLIGASTFESFVAHDKPTIDALNEAGLEVSAAGNHEFDRGYRDLVDRVMAPASADNPEGGAAWQYIAANVRFKNTENGHTAGDAALPETWFRTLPNGKTVGFVGAVTEDLPALVAGDGISEIEVTDIVDSVNANADELKAPGGCDDPEGCDLVVMLVHEGAANTSYSAVTNDSTFAHIVSGADENIDAIVSGHTHLAYNHRVPVQEWIEEGRAVTKRPVVSAGQYGANLNSLEFEYLPGTDQLVDIRQTVLALKDYDADADTQAIVDDAVDAAAEVGNRPLGDIAGPFQRARRNDPVAGGVVENRGGESTLGNLVAEIQRWKTDADIGFMNPGGLRADLLGALDGNNRVLTYRQAADVQPFANTLVTMDLTGAEIKTILEQQWQRDADGNIPSRPFLRLGTSDGFRSTYDPTRSEGHRITGMWLNGEELDPAASYRVAATSFLASGTGDNFWGFSAASNEQDTGKTDLQAVVDYMAARAPHGEGADLPVDYRQHAVGVTFPAGAPTTYAAGDTLAFDVTSLAMTGADDERDAQVELRLGDTVLGTFPVTNDLSSTPDDEAGSAHVTATVPATVADGTTEFTLRGVTTGTTVTVPVTTADGLATLNLLGINDFHGRINNNTVKFAGTVEQLTEEGGTDNTVLVGAGDLIGASEFASAIAEDQPTVDVMNALGLDASAVGNHEFDKGWADLRDRVIGPEGDHNALWDYLGANVYAKDTTDPVLPEYAVFDVDGVTVGVVGAVTEETSSLVSPAGIADIDFGNPADAVNRVAGELSDGDPANGEADVIVASFHAGARQGTGSNYEAEVAKGGEFAEMATLDPHVDAIFNGHTHQVYAWDAPVPGEPTRTRPIVQTGEYGANVGQVTLTVDRETGDVQSYTVRNVARTSRADSDLVAAYPRVAEVKQIVDQALADSQAIGNQPVGQITGDVTRAFRVGTYGPDGYDASRASGNEDRSAESTMGGLVGNALRDGLPAEMGTPDLGLVNPGGLREDLLYVGNTASNPANTDGVVTYAEANAVLPFVNNVSLVDLTGAELVQVLEEQWQRPAPGGPAPSRPYLQLGLSDNVEVTADASRPQDSRITSVRIDGERIDPAATYTVSTFSFLASGGDNFHTFKEGVARDTGLVDRDLWISYLKRTTEDGAAPIAPDFARQQVFEREMPAAVDPGQHVELTLGPDLVAPAAPVTGEKLDLTSLGTRLNTIVSMTAVPDEGTPQLLGSVPVSDGTAAVKFDVPDSVRTGGQIVLEAHPSGTTVTIPVRPAVETETSATADRMVYGTAGQVTVRVTSTRATTGSVQLLDGETLVATSEVASDGRATLTVPGTALPVGEHTLTVKYLGDETNNPSQTGVTLDVSPARSTTSATTSADQVKVKKGTTDVRAVVSATGVQPTGQVVVLDGATELGRARLSAGRATVEVGPFDKVGTRTLTVRYLGDDRVETSRTTVTVDVVKQTPKR